MTISSIGLLADTHGRKDVARRGVRLLLREGIDVLLHLGDIGSPDVLDAIAETLREATSRVPRLRIVLGNTDCEEDAIRQRARDLGIAVDHPVGRLDASGRTVAYQHGHFGAELQGALKEGVDYLFHGHTHERRDERIGQTRVINPGALANARELSVAVLHVPRDQVVFLKVPRAG